MMKRILIICYLLLGSFMGVSLASAKQPINETVVLLHGIGHTKWNMYVTELALQKAGYHTLGISYPSRSYEIKKLSEFVHNRIELSGLWQKQDRVHFVTHSMGGLVTRQFLNDYKEKIPEDKLGRVVMMAPPNSGSEVADFLKNFPPYKWLYGPAGQELTTEAQGNNNIKPYYELGIIAGTTGWPYLAGDIFLPGKHDGRVTVERTKLEGMKDHIMLPATHSFISWKPSVHSQIIHFLEEGHFSHEE